MRVLRFLTEQRVPFEALAHPPASSAQRRAQVLRVPGRQVVKAVLLAGPTGYLLAVLPAPRQLDLPKLSRLLGGAVRLATHEELTSIFRDCQPGAVLPLGVLYGLPSILDEAVDPQATIFFEGHTHFHAIGMSCRDYERVERPRRLAFSKELEPRAN